MTEAQRLLEAIEWIHDNALDFAAVMRRCQHEMRASEYMAVARDAGLPISSSGLTYHDGIKAAETGMMAHIEKWPDLGECNWGCTSVGPLVELLKKLKDSPISQDSWLSVFSPIDPTDQLP